MIDEALNKDETNEDMDKKTYKIHKLVWSSNPRWVFVDVVGGAWWQSCGSVERIEGVQWGNGRVVESGVQSRNKAMKETHMHMVGQSC